MATKCRKCGGIIPDVVYGGKDIYDCKNHIKTKDTFKGWIENSKR